MPSQSVYLPVAGLYTFPSDTTKAPPGAMVLAEDVVIDKEGLLEPRKGLPPFTAIFPFGSGSNRARKLYWYGGKLLALVDTTPPTLAYYDGANWQSYSGTFNYPDGVGGVVRPPAFEASGNFYLGTATGIQVLDSLTGTFVAAGTPKASSIRAIPSNSNAGFLAANAQVAYRVVWGFRDANNNLKLGAVSQRTTVTNPAGLSYAVGKLSKSGSAVVTATSPSAHGLQVGQFVTVVLGGVEANFTAGTFAVVAVTDSTHFTYNDGGASATAVSTQIDTITPTSTNVSITARLPSAITTKHFLQVYRTSQSVGASVDPGDSEQQVYEYSITPADVTAKTVTITDIADDAVRGAALYTNQNQEGIAANNEPPPLANEALVFKDSAFYLRTKGVQRLTLQLLGVSGWSSVIAQSIGFAPAGQLYPGASGGFTISAQASEAVQGGFVIATAGTPAQNVDATAQSIVRAINGGGAANANTIINATYVSGPDDAPGKILLEARTPGQAAFIAYLPEDQSSSGIASAVSPNLPISGFPSSIVRAGSTVTVTTVLRTWQDLAVGQQINLQPTGSLDANFPAGLKTIVTIPDASHFTYTEAGSAATASQQYTVTTLNTTPATSTADDAKNGVFWSKTRQPEAVPLGNSARPGSNTKAILKGAALRNSLFIFKEDGLYRLTGDYPNFNIQLFDPTVKLLLPESVRTLANYIYALTDQGVARISDTGVEIISRPIENLLPKSIDNTNLTPYGFAVSRESQHEYILFFNPAGGSPTVGLRFNAFTNTWTRWNVQATCGVVDPVADFLYLGDGQSIDVLRQNQAGSFLDYSDHNYTGLFTITSQNIAAKTITVTSTSGMAIGYGIGDGVHFSVITGFNGLVVSLADAYTWATSGLTTYAPVPSQVQWAPQVGADAMVFKHWRDVTADFKLAAFSSMTATFSSELATTGASVTLPGTSATGTAGVSQSVRTWCTPEAARSSQLNVNLLWNNGLAYWQLRGVEIDYRTNAGNSR